MLPSKGKIRLSEIHESVQKLVEASLISFTLTAKLEVSSLAKVGIPIEVLLADGLALDGVVHLLESLRHSDVCPSAVTQIFVCSSCLAYSLVRL